MASTAYRREERMKTVWTRAVLFGAVVAPLAAYGQMNASPTQPAQPNQPGTMQPNQGSAGMAGAMTASPSTGAGDAQTMKDKMFLRKAAAGGMAEVQLGRLAADKASSPDVKAFGQKMVVDHTALNNDMKPIAEQMGVMLPKKIKPADQAEYDKLSGMSGDDFDKEYLTYMVKDHHEDLREFRAEDSTVQDPTLKAAVDKGYQVIREHTQMVDKLAKDKGLPVPERRGGAPGPPAQQ